MGREAAEKIWGRLEIVGDIALIRVPFNTDPLILKPVAERLLRELPYIRSVWAGLPGVNGAYRLRPYVHLAGEERSETIYREHGCRFRVDIRRVYVSPALNYEHRRIAGLVRPGEVVTNMFAGAGFFSIIIARYSDPRRVYSIDINPDAYRYMLVNAGLNKVEGIVVPILGDAARIAYGILTDSSDRVLMPYPELALRYLKYAVHVLRGGRGFIHVYLHVDAGRGVDPLRYAAAKVLDGLDRVGAWGRVVGSRVVRTIAPRKYQVVVDLFVEYS